jgi:hypothetical protein
MASLFTPESERLRTSQSKADGTGAPPPGSLRIPGAKDIKGHKSGDSLGNPNSPGYEPWGRKTPSETAGEAPKAQGPGGTVIETTQQGPELIRLSVGWDKILLAQKKLCEKAKGLFTLLEGPEKYRSQRKSKILSIKSRGCIVDLQVEEAPEKTKDEKGRGRSSA